MYPNEKPVPRRFPKVPIDRRFFAFLIDFVAIWFISSFVTNWFIQGLVFLFTWFALRVVVVEKNHGQSLGRWALDMKILELRTRRIPDLLSLVKREGITGGAAVLAMAGFNLFFSSALSTILLVLPLAVTCGIAIADEQYQQALHDKVAGTVIIETRRGFSLDLRLKKIVADLRYRMRK